jgi:AbrB family looped-hinge helix DNA binding protein
METTRLSSKGQIVIPQHIRQAHQWLAGDEFAVVELEGGILLTPIKSFKPYTVKEVLGCLNYKGTPKTLDEMEKAIADEARKKNDNN